MCCQANDSVVAVLEKVASLDDKEEVTRLAADAEGRKFFRKFIACPSPYMQTGRVPTCFPVFDSIFDPVRCAMVYKREMCQPPLSIQIGLVFWGTLAEV